MEGLLRANPSAIVHDSLIPEATSTQVTLQNVGSRIVRVRLAQDFSRDVRAAFARGDSEFAQLAPGVSIDVDVATHVSQDLEDAVHFFINDEQEFTVPVVYTPPRADVRMEGPVDFGRVMDDGEVHTKYARLVNDGNAPATFHLLAEELQDKRLRILPSSGTLARAGEDGCDQMLRVELTANSTEPCSERLRIEVDRDMQAELPISASMIGQSLHLADPVSGKRIASHDLGCIYYGTERPLKLMLVNDRPTDTMFVVKPLEHHVWLYTANGREPCFSYSSVTDIVAPIPMDGRLSTNERRVLQFIFQPSLSTEEAQTPSIQDLPYAARRDFRCRFRVVGLNTELAHDIELTGSAVVPTFALEPQSLKFDDCLIGEREEEVVVLRNTSNQLPLSFEVERAAHFAATPARGLLLPGDGMQIAVAFTPRQPGRLKTNLVLRLGHGTVKTTVAVDGAGVMGRRDELALRSARRTQSRFSAKPVKSDHVPKNAPLDTGTIKQSLFAQTQMRKASKSARLRPLPTIQVTTTTPATPSSRITRKRVINPKSPFRRNPRNPPSISIAPRDLQQLQLGPESFIDFGRVCASSRLTRSLTFTNTLATELKLQVACVRREFLPTVSSASVPAGETAIVSVTLTNIDHETPESLKTSVVLLVNKVHEVHIPVMARVVPFELEIDQTELTLSCGSCVKQPRPCAFITLHNPFGRTARFFWEVRAMKDGQGVDSAPAFHVDPEEGELGPLSSAKAQVTLNPGAYDPSVTYLLALNLEHSDAVKTVRCTASFAHSRCCFKQSRTSFGALSQNSRATRVARLYNDGFVDAYFQITDVYSQFKLAEVSITPANGYVPARSFREFNITCAPTRIGKFDATIVVDIKGNETLKHIITGQVVPIKLSVDRDEFDFGRVVLGQFRPLPFTVTNNSNSHVTLTFDFEQLEGCLAIHRDIFDATEPPAESVALPPGEETQLFARFTAMEVTSFAESFTIHANGNPALQCAVRATVLSCLVHISPTALDFGLVSLNEEATRTVSVKHTGTLPTTVTFDCSQLHARGIVLVDDKLVPSGDNKDHLLLKVADGEQREVLCHFHPTQAFTTINITLPILVGAADEPYMDIAMHAAQLMPELRLSASSLQLGCVPLGAEKVFPLELRTVGYTEAVELDFTFEAKPSKADEARHARARSWKSGQARREGGRQNPISAAKRQRGTSSPASGGADRSHAAAAASGKKPGVARKAVIKAAPVVEGSQCISVVFPNGNIVQPYVPLQVEVRVFSNAPADINETLVIYDTESRSTALEVGGVVDSTVYSRIIDVADNSTEFAQMCNTLERYLQLFGLSYDQYLEIPTSFTQKCGWLLADIVQYLSHSTIPRLPLTRPETLTKQQQHGMLVKMLRFLRQRGALLHNVSIEDMLADERTPRQLRAWVTVLAQVVRVLVLGQLPPLPGAAGAQGDEDGDDDNVTEATASDVTASRESHPAAQLANLKAWINSCVAARGNAALSRGLNNFEADIADALVLADLLIFHVPEMDELSEHMFAEADTQCKQRHNAICVVQALQKLRITLCLDSEDICSPNEAFITLVLCRLAHVLPKFSADATVLEAEGTVGSQLSMGASVSNSHSDRPMVFHTLSFGSSKFSVPDKIKVTAGESVSVPVKVSSVASGHYALTLFCIGRVKNRTELHVRKFELRARVQRKPTGGALSMEAKCYHQQEAKLTVSRPARSARACTVKTMEMDDAGEVVHPHCPSFWIEQNEVVFDANTPQATLTANFLPTRLGPHHLCVVVADPKSGREKVYGVEGNALTPEPLKSLSFATQLQKTTPFTLDVPYTNEARRQALSRISLATSSLRNLPPMKARPPHLLPQAVDLNVGIKGCPFVEAPEILRLQPSSAPLAAPVRRASMAMLEHPNTLMLDFQPVAAGSYTFDVHLTGPEDVRVYRVRADVTEAVELDASTDTAVGTSSGVPLCMNNPCDTRHEYSISLEGDAEAFRCPDHVALNPHEQYTIMVTFVPQREGEHTAVVKVVDLSTQVESRYSITGHALPLPEEDTSPSTSRARSAVSARTGGPVRVHATVWDSAQFRVKVRNETPHPKSYSVSFFSNDVLSDELVYDMECEVPARSTENVSCEYFPVRAGEFRGMLAIEDFHGHALEVPVRFTAHRAEPAVLPPVACALSSSAEIVIPVSNPISQDVVVAVDGESLDADVAFSPTQISLAAHATAEFVMAFTPEKTLEDNVVDPDEPVTKVKNVLLTGTHGLTWHYVLPVTVFAGEATADDDEGGVGNEEAQPAASQPRSKAQVVPVVCGEEKLFEIEINNSHETETRTYVLEVQQKDLHLDGLARFSLLRKTNRIKVPPQSTKSIPMCLQAKRMCAHHAIVKALLLTSNSTAKEKTWHLVGLVRPSIPCKPGVIKSSPREEVSRTFTIALVDAAPDLDPSQLSVDLDGLDDVGHTSCQLVRSSDDKDAGAVAVKCQCTVMAARAGKYQGVLHVYHHDGFFWEKPLTVLVQPQVHDTIEICSSDLVGVDSTTIRVPPGDLDTGPFTVQMTPAPACMWTSVEDGVVEDTRQGLDIPMYFEPAKSTGITEARVQIRFESGHEVAFAVRGVKPGLATSTGARS